MSLGAARARPAAGPGEAGLRGPSGCGKRRRDDGRVRLGPDAIPASPRSSAPSPARNRCRAPLPSAGLRWVRAHDGARSFPGLRRFHAEPQPAAAGERGSAAQATFSAPAAASGTRRERPSDRAFARGRAARRSASMSEGRSEGSAMLAPVEIVPAHIGREANLVLDPLRAQCVPATIDPSKSSPEASGVRNTARCRGDACLEGFRCPASGMNRKGRLQRG